MPEFILVIFEYIRDFMELGGPVLYLIAGLLIIMWFMIIERIFYIRGAHRSAVKSAIEEWESRTERKSWAAHQVREELVSRVASKLRENLSMIQACVALAPLFGLLGTVTGMIEVFQVMAINGTSNARAMAGGVSRATVPTMAGMVAALSGLFLSFWLQRKAEQEREKLNENLTLDH
ncbi:MotA/TolQ/ExbB proton channel family protein [Arenicella xantha]|uniref:Outer membrane transport energization protein ExbB n=1 Tax=Arenicella xantha TaxID=644221 RepID=A0A395JUD5_9GAMM|nr:MotA/TolQ/ExbB proton channel family protein [Arenicella xantha]RBP53158.1 outer membrane transport energization protein ExbB [Arenicella xantha]